MLALITGATSGIGLSFARDLSEQGYDLILVARRKRKLESIKKSLKTNVEIINIDLSSTYHVFKLFERVKSRDIDLLINNAGFGIYGDFSETNLDKEIDLLDLNIKTVHILTKLFVQLFEERQKGTILNVASLAGFMPGPKMATYYASKNYVLRLTEAIYQELKERNSKVQISVLCPGPVRTEFNKVANVTFHMKSLTKEKVTKYTLKKLKQKKLIIIPGFQSKCIFFFYRFLSIKRILKICYNVQKKKGKK